MMDWLIAYRPASYNWVGAPLPIGEVLSSPQMMPPVETASNLYLTFNVEF